MSESAKKPWFKTLKGWLTAAFWVVAAWLVWQLVKSLFLKKKFDADLPLVPDLGQSVVLYKSGKDSASFTYSAGTDGPTEFFTWRQLGQDGPVEPTVQPLFSQVMRLAARLELVRLLAVKASTTMSVKAVKAVPGALTANVKLADPGVDLGRLLDSTYHNTPMIKAVEVVARGDGTWDVGPVGAVDGD